MASRMEAGRSAARRVRGVRTASESRTSAAGAGSRVRDDGRGFSLARLAEARAEGRLGVASSIEGRVRDLGGTMAVESAPGAGTEIELRVPMED